MGQIAVIRKRIREWVKMTHENAVFAGGLRVATATLTCGKGKNAIKIARI